MNTLEEVYEYVNVGLNKAQKSGYVSPDEFTIALKAVNRRMFNALRALYEETQSISDDMRVVVKTMGTPDDAPMVFNALGYASLPSDYEGYVSSSHYTTVGTDCDGEVIKKWVPIEILNSNEFDHRVNSKLLEPDSSCPISVIENNKYRVYPKIKKARFVYFRTPAEPFFDYIVTSGAIVYLPPGGVHDGTGELVNGSASRSVEMDWTNYQACADVILRVLSVMKRAEVPLQEAMALEQNSIAQWLNKP